MQPRGKIKVSYIRCHPCSFSYSGVLFIPATILPQRNAVEHWGQVSGIVTSSLVTQILQITKTPNAQHQRAARSAVRCMLMSGIVIPEYS
jgi:hypothetical protein